MLVPVFVLLFVEVPPTAVYARRGCGVFQNGLVVNYYLAGLAD